MLCVMPGLFSNGLSFAHQVILISPERSFGYRYNHSPFVGAFGSSFRLIEVLSRLSKVPFNQPVLSYTRISFEMTE